MDFRQIAAAVKAHKVVAIVGVLAAVTLAFLAHVRVDPLGHPMFEYRKSVLWSSTITLQLTQEGFYEGRVRDVASRRDALVGLAPLYARLANSDQVRQKMKTLGPIYGGVDIQPVVDANQVSLPLIKISSFSRMASKALTRSERQATAFRTYLAQQQDANGVPDRNRVLLRVVGGPSAPSVVVPRKITLPVVVFLALLVVTGAVILTLENLRRAKRRSTDESENRPPLEALKGPDEDTAPVVAPSQRQPASVSSSPGGRKVMSARTLGADMGAGARGGSVDGAAADDERADGRPASPDVAEDARASRRRSHG